MSLRMAEWIDPLVTFVRQAPWLTLVWIAVLGGCIGSFMNVVVYRLPRGMSLLHPGSHCPSCQQPIRWYDNLPVIGWLCLRGRCRDCRATISPRYPLVESLILLLFAIQWIRDVWHDPDADALGASVFAFVWHVSLLCSLICAALIDFDGHSLPRSLLLCGASVPLVMTSLSPAATSRLLEADDPSVWTAIVSGAALAALVTFVTTLPPRVLGREQNAHLHSQRWTPLALSAMSGMYLGPERAVVTLLSTTLLWWLLRSVRRSTGGAPWTWYLAALCWVAVATPIE
jgi:leader peptidase (prepilin peptidase)/N-methyltransferase